MEEGIDRCGVNLAPLVNEIDRAGDPVVARQALQAEVDRLNAQCRTDDYFVHAAGKSLEDQNVKGITAKEITLNYDPVEAWLVVDKPILSAAEQRTCDALVAAVRKGDSDAFRQVFDCADLNALSWEAILANLGDELQRDNKHLEARSVEDTANGKLYLIIQERASSNIRLDEVPLEVGSFAVNLPPNWSQSKRAR